MRRRLRAMAGRWARRAVLSACLTAAALSCAWAAVSLSCPPPAGRLAGRLHGSAAMVLDRRGRLLARRVDGRDQWRFPVPLRRVSPWMVTATLAAEDRRFWDHEGVDPHALLRALGQNLSAGRRVSGASTLTMQVVRLARPRPRTLPSKFVESVQALRLEAGLAKEAILEAYLNLAPYGGNVTGVEAAARVYFGKSAARLTLGEAALLAGLPQSPTRFHPVLHLDRALERREYVLGRMLALGWIGPDEAARARRQRIRIAPHRPATLAPRFADYVLAPPGRASGRVRTTLDAVTQERVRAGMERFRRHRADGEALAFAAVVIDVAASELRAMVGSLDPDDPRHGCVNAATALRQPGSLLKPFVYAEAFEAGLLTPGAVVYDVPRANASYRPRNMDRSFLGPMSASEALRASRNLPVVRLLARLGPARVAQRLAGLGLGLEGAEERCGLSLALGTAETRLVDVANAYAALARLGRWSPLRSVQGRGRPPVRQALSEEAAYLTLRALGAPAPGRPGRQVWKTGTSWDNRDAWAVALTPDLVVAVWCGRLSGRGHAGLTGRSAALPLATSLLDGLSGDEIHVWHRPAGVRVRRVCALSGAPASSGCPLCREDEYMPGRSCAVPCRLHGRGGEVRWPDDVAAFLSSPASGKAPASRSLRIVSPRPGSYLLPPATSGARDSLLLRAAGAAPGERVFWFVDSEQAGCTTGRQVLAWSMRPGSHTLAAVTASGQSARLAFRVKALPDPAIQDPSPGNPIGERPVGAR